MTWAWSDDDNPTAQEGRGMTRRVRRLLTVASLACMTMLVLGPLARGADVPGAAQWISADDAVLYAEITRPETLIDRVTSDRIEELLRAVPGLDDSLRENRQLRELQQVARYLADELDTEPVEGVRTLVGGGIVAAVEGTRQAGPCLPFRDAEGRLVPGSGPREASRAGPSRCRGEGKPRPRQGGRLSRHPRLQCREKRGPCDHRRARS